MKYTIDSPEFLAAYITLNEKLEPTGKTYKIFGNPGCSNCIFDYDSDECDPFAHLRDTFNKKEFEEKYPELLI
ncbi:MAG: hypothetical protein PVF17_05950 [Ignavibacteria bacterium]|jgi:hypothetical protein